MQERTTITLLAGHKKSGDPVHEELLVDRLSASHVRLVATPGLLLGVAAGDVLELHGSGGYTIIERGGNLGVQVFGDASAVDHALAEALDGLDYRVDGRTPKLTVLTLPVAQGFPAVEKGLNGLCHNVPGSEWYFGNVYDNDDGVTPLNWWVKA